MKRQTKWEKWELLVSYFLIQTRQFSDHDTLQSGTRRKTLHMYFSLVSIPLLNGTRTHKMQKIGTSFKVKGGKKQFKERGLSLQESKEKRNLTMNWDSKKEGGDRVPSRKQSLTQVEAGHCNRWSVQYGYKHPFSPWHNVPFAGKRPGVSKIISKY